jgi:filamentous hemagglutinin
MAWDINQLQHEQKILQPIHEKYLGDANIFNWVSTQATGGWRNFVPGLGIGHGVNVLDYNSRITYGCKLLGYSAKQGCK